MASLSPPLTMRRLQRVRVEFSNKYRRVTILKIWSWLILNFCILLFLPFPQLSISEFRFCVRGHGPHRINELDCPGGFIARMRLNVSCLYYGKGSDEIPDLQVTLSPDMCDTTAEIRLNADGEGYFADYKTFQSVYFELRDEATDPSPGIDIDSDICALDCLTEWHDFSLPEDDSMFKDKPSISREKQQKYEESYTRLSKQLFMVLIKDEFYDEISDSDPTLSLANFISGNSTTQAINLKGMLNIITLLAQSMKITIRKCAPFVETSFYLQVLKVMIYLHSKSRSYSMVEIDSQSFRKIAELLESCEESANTAFFLNGTSCDGTHSLTAITSLTGEEETKSWKYRRQPRSFRWGAYDPIIESAWIAVDFVHGFCFPTFHKAEALLHFHLYVEAMLALFPAEPVQQHWMYPVKLKNDDGFWNKIMDTGDIKNQMRNLDACAIAAYMDQANLPYNSRLLRPFVKEEQVENPSYAEPKSGNDDDDNGNGKGWRKSVADYWKWYERQGGFKEISKEFGYCLDGSKENLEKVEESLKEKGLNCSSSTE